MIKISKIKILSLFSAAVSLLGVILYFDLPKSNILFIPLFYALYIGFKSIVPKVNTKDGIFCGKLSIIYSTMLILGYQLDTYNGFIYNTKTILALLCFPFVIFIIIYAILNYFNNLTLKESKINISNKRLKLLIFLLIFVIWFLGFLAIFPGLYGYDAGFQFMEFDIPDYTVTSHFSILHSYLFYFLVNLGYKIFNSYKIGFAIYGFLQMLFLCSVTSKVCYYIYNKFKNIKLLTISVLFFALSPFAMILSLSACQDAIFAGIFVLVILSTLDMIENSKIFWSSWKKILTYFILIFLLCAFRNNGLYAFIVLVPFAIIFIKKYKLHFMILSFLAISLFEVYKGPFHNLLEIQKGDSLKEMSSVIVQQFGRVYCYKKDSLSDEELAYITHLIPEESLAIYEYNPCISDALKGALNTGLLKSDYLKFIKTYLSVGVKNPGVYIQAFLLNNIGTWYPNKTYPDSRMYHPFIEYEMLDAKKWNEHYIIIERTSFFPLYEKVLNIFVNKSAWNKLPIVSTIFSGGTYFFIFIFVVTYTIYNKKYMYLVPLSLVLGLYLTILLAPVTLYRYLYPIILCTPIIFSFVLNRR